MGNGSGQWATLLSPGRAREQSMCAAIAWSGNRGAPKEGNEREFKAWQKV